MKALSVHFAHTARILGDAARRNNMQVPSFRSPPRVAGRTRTLRRHADRSITVSLVVRGRPWSAVVSDMIESFVVANELEGHEAEVMRDQLWLAATDNDIEGLPASPDIADPPEDAASPSDNVTALRPVA